MKGLLRMMRWAVGVSDKIGDRVLFAPLSNLILLQHPRQSLAIENSA